MTQLFALTARQHAITDFNITPYAAIAAALASIRWPSGAALVGPPRVTRRAVIGSGFDTYATAILAWPDPPPGGQPQNPALISRVFSERIVEALNAAGGGWDATVRVAPYLDAVNGPDLAWWRDGRASQTRTRDAYPTLGGRVDADENPYGPDSPAVRTSTLGEAGQAVAQGISQSAQQLGGGLTSLLLPIAFVVGGIAAAIYLGPVVLPALGVRLAGRGRKRQNPESLVSMPVVLAGLTAGGLAYLLWRRRTAVDMPVAAKTPATGSIYVGPWRSPPGGQLVGRQ